MEKSLISKSIVRRDLYYKCCDHIYESNACRNPDMSFQGGDIVFCKIDKVLQFFEKLRLTRKKIILVTGEGCYPCDEFRQRFLPENVERWFSTNVTHLHPKVIALPLGLGEETDETTLNISEQLIYGEDDDVKSKWLYVNFRPETNLQVRQPIYDLFQQRAQQESWITFEAPQSCGKNKMFLEQLKKHQFVLAPPGRGVDTHRLWEVLTVGAYPVVLKSIALEPFQALPILFVDDYNEVTLDFLKANLQQLEEKRSHCFMLEMNYWEQKIKESSILLKQQPFLSFGEWVKDSLHYGMGMMQRRLLNVVWKKKKRKQLFLRPDSTELLPSSKSIDAEKRQCLKEEQVNNVKIISENFVRSDLFQKNCDYIYWSNAQPKANTHFKAGDIVFCKMDEVLRLFEHLRLTRKRIVLVTGESDIPCNFFRQQFLPCNVVQWFANNVTHPHPRVTALPLGLGGMQDLVTLNIHSQKSDISREQWLYINFRPETNCGVRQEIYNSFQSRAQQEHWMTFESPKDYGNNEEFLAQLRRHRFVLAPPGNGVDTHRLWEALALGAYPIALRSSVLQPFEALPILFVDHYNEITLDFLKKNFLEFQTKEQNLFMLQMDFWVQKIKDAKLSLKGKEKLTWRKWLEKSFLYGLSIIKRRASKEI